MRTSTVARKTSETDISLSLNLDGSGDYKIDTGIGFFNHMMELFAKHAQVDLKLTCQGDVAVDAHHTVEDCGIVLGEAILIALGKKEKIKRYATKFVPMDETLMMASLDISGRPYLAFHADVPQGKLGNFETELFEEFFRAVAYNGKLTLHMNLQYGKNAHHIIEAGFKAFGQALREASMIDPTLNGVLSTKGML